MLMLGILVFMLFEAPREEREINSFIFILFYFIFGVFEKKTNVKTKFVRHRHTLYSLFLFLGSFGLKFFLEKAILIFQILGPNKMCLYRYQK